MSHLLWGAMASDGQTANDPQDRLLLPPKMGLLSTWMLMVRIAPGATMLLMSLAIILRPDPETGTLHYIRNEYGLSVVFLVLWFAVFGLIVLIWRPEPSSPPLLTVGIYVTLTSPLLFFGIVSMWVPMFVHPEYPLTGAVSWLSCYMFLLCIYFLGSALNEWQHDARQHTQKVEQQLKAFEEHKDA